MQLCAEAVVLRRGRRQPRLDDPSASLAVTSVDWYLGRLGVGGLDSYATDVSIGVLAYSLRYLQPRQELATLRAVHAHLPRHGLKGGVVAGDGRTEVATPPLERPVESIGHCGRIRAVRGLLSRPPARTRAHLHARTVCRPILPPTRRISGRSVHHLLGLHLVRVRAKVSVRIRIRVRTGVRVRARFRAKVPSRRPPPPPQPPQELASIFPPRLAAPPPTWTQPAC
eukprot:scaffold19039_cov72-Phaeocystis_antarctica.AAC.4